jgi:hypothetical protein
MESQEARRESRRKLLKTLAAGSVLVWTVPLITSASPVQGQGPCGLGLSACVGDPVNCFPEDPSTGYCATDDDCFPGSCSFSGCTPACCYCSCDNVWVCTSECGGHCIGTAPR